jgi:hypothetical protein
MFAPPLNADLTVILPIKRFMLIEQCPVEWRALDLYLFQDKGIVFYVGQSDLAFARVWNHIRNGFRARSVMGRFILCNWPLSLNFQIELLSSRADRFAAVAHNLNAAEGQLIQQWAPCFNLAQNRQPTPLPDRYTPPTAPLRCGRSLNRLIHEAERAVKADERRQYHSGLTAEWPHERGAL